MKPDWKDAPKWASWLAMDSNGLWYWYESMPSLVGDSLVGGSWETPSGKIKFALIKFEAFKNSLEQRP
jgi:hypothetical protein